MTFGRILFAMCLVFFIMGTTGLVRNIVDRVRQNKVRKRYAEMQNQK